MKLYSISIRSLVRRKAKTIFLIIGLILSVASVVTLLTVSENVNASIATNLDEFGANIIITPKSDDFSFNYAGVTVNGDSYNRSELHNDDLTKIKTIKNKENISIIAPKLISFESINNRKIVVTGVRFNDEIKLKKWWKIEGRIPSASDELLAGAEVKMKLGLKLNDQLTIKEKPFKVTGFLSSTGSQDDAMIFMNIDESQRLFGKKNKVSLIEVAALCYDCPIEEIVKQTSNALPNADVTPIKQTIESKMTAMHRFEHFSLGISGVILIISILIVFTNVNASVNERIQEIGIFQAVGFRRSHIMQVILIEVLTASFLAGFLGYGIGTISAKFIIPILAMDEKLKMIYDYNLLFLSIGISLIVGLIASLYPAYRATKLDPTTAFRSL